MDKKKRKAIILDILIAVFGIIFLVSAGVVAWYYIDSNKASNEFDSLEAAVEEHVAEIESTDSDDDSSESSGTGFEILKEKNSDFDGWISIGGTNIRYPVMYTPNYDEYYLRRSFDGNYSYSGTPFIGTGCSSDSLSFIIYSHNMRNGTMFSDLTKYESYTFWQEHPCFTYTTVDEVRTYEIFAAFATSVPTVEEESTTTLFKYYNYVGDLSEADFNQLINGLNSLKYYDTGIDLQYGDQILMLSTCSYHTENGRFVVAAVRVS